MLIMCSIIFANAQVKTPQMQLSRIGFVGADTTKNYVVLEVPNMSKGDLYTKAMAYLTTQYKNPALAVRPVGSESIVVNAMDNQISLDGNLYKYPFNYNVVLQFKDGKIKFEPKIFDIKEVFTVDGSAKVYYLSSTDSPNPHEINSIWTKSNKDSSYFLLNKDLKNALDQWLNKYIENLSAGIKQDW
jgi:hypothetical protein